MNNKKLLIGVICSGLLIGSQSVYAETNENVVDIVVIDDTKSIEEDDTVVIDDIKPIEEDDTVVIDDIKPIEKDDTVVIDDTKPIEEDGTVVIDDIKLTEEDETVKINDTIQDSNDTREVNTTVENKGNSSMQQVNNSNSQEIINHDKSKDIQTDEKMKVLPQTGSSSAVSVMMSGVVSLVSSLVLVVSNVFKKESK